MNSPFSNQAQRFIEDFINSPEGIAARTSPEAQAFRAATPQWVKDAMAGRIPGVEETTDKYRRLMGVRKSSPASPKGGFRRAYRNMAAHWGDECPEFEPGCACCQAWKMFWTTFTYPKEDDVFAAANAAAQQE